MPLDSEILTRDGWKTYEQVRLGDETIGYNPETGCGEWTPVTDIHRYAEAPLVRMHNQRFDVRCTPNHRWVTDKLIQHPDGNSRREGFTETQHLGSRHRIRLAVTQADSPGLPISPAEAELLGWVAGDGYISHYRSRTPGSTHWRTGTGAMRRLRLTQAKPQRIAEIDTLVAGLPFSRHEYAPKGISRQPQVTWAFGSRYSADLLERSGYERGLEQMVLGMAGPQREAFLRGLLGADGHASPRGGNPVLAQNTGAVLDAAMLAMYLTGHYPHLTNSARQKHVVMGKAQVKGGMKIEECDPAPVWCVTTGLGSWTARQSGQVFLTGNSRYGTPAAAWGHELAYRWYDQGGWLPPGLTLALNTTGRPEQVISGRGGGAATPVVLEIRSSGRRADDLLVELIRDAVRVRGGGNVQVALGKRN